MFLRVMHLADALTTLQTGRCIKTMLEHSHTVNGLCWLADGSGFVTGGMDRKIIHWVYIHFTAVLILRLILPGRAPQGRLRWSGHPWIYEYRN
jgi:WD40 repeat protein